MRPLAVSLVSGCAFRRLSLIPVTISPVSSGLKALSLEACLGVHFVWFEVDLWRLEAPGWILARHCPSTGFVLARVGFLRQVFCRVKFLHQVCKVGFLLGHFVEDDLIFSEYDYFWLAKKLFRFCSTIIR